MLYTIFGIVLLAPAFLAVSIALLVAFSDLRALACSIWLATAVSLMFVSFAIFRSSERYRESWSAQEGGDHSSLIWHAVGFFVLMMCFAIRAFRTKPFWPAFRRAFRFPDKKSTDY